MITLVSWNVNGLRSCERKGFLDWFRAFSPDILCMQEVRAELSDLPPACQSPEGYHTHWNAAQKKGYSGVATWSRQEPRSVSKGIGVERFDTQGRVLVTEFAAFTLYNVYFPKGGDVADPSLEKFEYKLDFYDEFTLHIAERLKRGDRLIVCGDFNIAHTELDLARPKENAKNVGFSLPERDKLDRFLSQGFRDVFRERHSGEKGLYTWWSNRGGARERNVGWRIDYFMVSENLLPAVQDALIMPEVTGSDHCPVVLKIDASLS